MPGKGSIGWSSWGWCREKTGNWSCNRMGCYRKKSVPLDADGAVKVLSEKMGSNENF